MRLLCRGFYEQVLVFFPQIREKCSHSQQALVAHRVSRLTIDQQTAGFPLRIEGSLAQASKLIVKF